MSRPLGGVIPSWDRLCVCVDLLILPAPLSHDSCMVRTAQLTFWRACWPIKLEFWVWFHQYQESLPQGPVTSFLVLTHHHHLHWQKLPLYQTPQERVSWLLFRLLLYLFPVRFLPAKSCYSQSLDNVALVFGLHSHRPASCLATTSTIWSEWTQPDGPFS